MRRPLTGGRPALVFRGIVVFMTFLGGCTFRQKDYDGDMAKLSAEPHNQKWLSMTDPMQV
jgi:L-rhamnose mutarotase